MLLCEVRFVAHQHVTTLGRVRFGTESYVKIELVNDLYRKLSVYENYDNRPGTTSAPRRYWLDTLAGLPPTP